jgi:hypothetical protein
MIRHWILEGRLSASQEELLVGFGKEQDSRKLRVRKLEDHLKVRVIALAGMHCPYHHLGSSVHSFIDQIDAHCSLLDSDS